MAENINSVSVPTRDLLKGPSLETRQRCSRGHQSWLWLGDYGNSGIICMPERLAPENLALYGVMLAAHAQPLNIQGVRLHPSLTHS